MRLCWSALLACGWTSDQRGAQSKRKRAFVARILERLLCADGGVRPCCVVVSGVVVGAGGLSACVASLLF
jgi:hypothetical protein